MKTAYERGKFTHNDKTITIYKGDDDSDSLSFYSEPYFLAREIANIIGKSKKEMLEILSGHKKVKAKRILKGQECPFLTKEGFEICLSFNQLDWEIDLKFATLAYLEKTSYIFESNANFNNFLSESEESKEKYSKEELTIFRARRDEREKILKFVKEECRTIVKQMEFYIENCTQVCKDAKMVIDSFNDAENMKTWDSYIAFIPEANPYIQNVQKTLDELEKYRSDRKNRNALK